MNMERRAVNATRIRRQRAIRRLDFVFMRMQVSMKMR